MAKGITPKKPERIAPVHIKSFSKLFKGLARTFGTGAALVASGGSAPAWASFAAAFVETLESLGFKKNTPENLAWELVSRAISRALYELLRQSADALTNRDAKEWDAATEHVLAGNTELLIDEDFFAKPGESGFLTGMQGVVRQWLEQAAVSPAEADTLARRLPALFVYALHEEWRENPGKYETLQEYFSSPFYQAVAQEREWERYNAWLQRQVDDAVFAATFSLRQIYVPLRAWHGKKRKKEKAGEAAWNEPKKIVVDLKDFLEEWLAKEDKDDVIRVISGGPGCGKSSFAKMLAADLSERFRVIFLPLHLINTSENLKETVSDFLKDSQFFETGNPLDAESLVLIFDGLDELSMQGKACAEAAKHFVGMVERTVERWNTASVRVRAIMTGRNVVVQSNEQLFEKPHQILHVLPYYIPEHEHEEYSDRKKLLARDDRDGWWKTYAELTGKEYEGMPRELRNNSLDELTAQPLLSYLIALTYERGTLRITEDTNLNEIYRDLICGVHQRAYSKPHATVSNVGEKDFLLILEEIAVCAWHGKGRTTTVGAIERHCETSQHLQKLLAQFAESAKAGVTNLLTAFYFRRTGKDDDGDSTFEFTHKSFGEYLLACRVVRQVETFARKFKAEEEGDLDSWDEEEALTRWGKLCGPAPLDEYSFHFLRDEVRLKAKNGGIDVWQAMVCRCIEYVLRKGMPRAALPGHSLQEDSRVARNAEEALLAAHSACAWSTGVRSNIQWPDRSAARHWLQRLIGQAADERPLSRSCLNHIDFDGSSFERFDFSFAKAQYSSFKGSRLERTLFEHSDMSHANFSNAFLARTDLVACNLESAVFENAQLLSTTFDGTFMPSVSFRGALFLTLGRYSRFERDSGKRRFLGANGSMTGVDLSDADFTNAHLSCTDFSSSFETPSSKGLYWVDVSLKTPTLREHAFTVRLCAAENSLQHGKRKSPPWEKRPVRKRLGKNRTRRVSEIIIANRCRNLPPLITVIG